MTDKHKEIQTKSNPEACQIPNASTIRTADQASIDELRRSLGIEEAAPTSQKDQDETMVLDDNGVHTEKRAAGAPEACHVPNGSRIDQADSAQIDALRESLGIKAVDENPEEERAISSREDVKKAKEAHIERLKASLGIESEKEGNAPEACHVPSGDRITSADLSQIDELRKELGIEAQPTEEDAPQACAIPKNSTIDAASAAQINKLRESLGIEKKETQAPEACKIPNGSTIDKAEQSQIDELREELGIQSSGRTAPAVASGKHASLEDTNKLKEQMPPSSERKHAHLPHTVSAESILAELGYTSDNPMNITIDEKEIESDALGQEEVRNILSRYKAADETDPLITVLKDGPYLVTGSIPLSASMIKADKEGQSVGWYKTKAKQDGKTYALCRCGKSKHMPFCDGTHEHIIWDSTCTASTEPYIEAAKVYEAADGCYLLDQENLCAIVRYCDPHGSCWDLCQRENTLAEGIIETMSCASGRLTVVRGGKLVEPEFEPEIEAIDDKPRGKMGPFWVKGGIRIKTEDGVEYEVRNRVTLCRCGKSKNKPFCDGYHLRADDPDEF